MQPLERHSADKKSNANILFGRSPKKSKCLGFMLLLLLLGGGAALYSNRDAIHDKYTQFKAEKEKAK